MTILALGVVLSKDNEHIAGFYLLAGLALAGLLLEKGMVLPAAVQAISSAMGMIALLIFGGDVVER